MGGRTSARRAGGRLWDPLLAVGVYAAALAVFLPLVVAADRQGVLTGEEASVSFADVVGLEQRFQYTHWSTNFASHLYFWVATALDPSFGLFYGRRWKALAVALLPALVFWTLRRRLRCRRPAAVLGGLAAALLPGVAGFAWPAIEPGLEAVLGMAALLIATSRRRWWPAAPVLAGLALSAYGAGAAWAAAVLAVVVVRLVRRPRWPAVLGAVAATAAGAGIVLFPIWWWHGGTVVLGGGEPTGDQWSRSLGRLAHELFVQGNSYYYFSSLPALGPLPIAVAGCAGLALACRWRPQIWPWLVVVLATVVAYAVSGGVLGIRRTVALPVVLALGLGLLVDLALRAVAVRRRSAGLVAVGTALAAVAVVLPLALSVPGTTRSLATGAVRLPVDLAFPMAPGERMPETLARIDGEVRSGVPWATIAQRWDGTRTSSLVYLLQAHGALPPSGLTRATVQRLYEAGEKCETDCRRIAGVK